MDNLAGASRPGNGKNKPFKPFRQQPGKGRATIPDHGANGAGIRSMLKQKQILGKIFPPQRKTLPLFKAGKAKLADIVRTLPIKTVISNQTGPKPAPHVHTSISSRLKVDFAPVVNPALLACRLGHFLPNWRPITNNPTILETIQGYQTRAYLNSRPKNSQTTPSTIFLF